MYIQPYTVNGGVLYIVEVVLPDVCSADTTAVVGGRAESIDGLRLIMRHSYMDNNNATM